MLRQIVGKQILELPESTLQRWRSGYIQTTLDLGTGDGKFVFTYAKRNPNIAVIGLDAAKENVADTSRKVLSKPEKGGLPNIVFVWSSVEDMPEEFEEIADEIWINFPWGSLLKGVVDAEAAIMQPISKVAKKGASLNIRLTYDPKFEPSKITALKLPELTMEYLKEDLIPKFRAFGWLINEVRELTDEEIDALEGSWSKKITANRSRNVYFVRAVKE